jgi:hypothetical protein
MIFEHLAQHRIGDLQQRFYDLRVAQDGRNDSAPEDMLHPRVIERCFVLCGARRPRHHHSFT